MGAGASAREGLLVMAAPDNLRVLPARPAFAGVPADAAETPIGRLSGRRALLPVAAAVLLVGSLVLLAPALADLPEAASRLGDGDGRWLALALGLEVASFAGYVLLFRGVFRDAGPRIDLRTSTEITLAGTAATRLLASGGAGGVALTAWALRRSGLERRVVGQRMVAFMVLLYGVYMAALVVGGLGLALGLVPGSAPFAVTIPPAALGAVVIVVALSSQRVRSGRLAPVGDGVRQAVGLLRRRDPALGGALLWWGADIAVLAACFAAFGDVPPAAVVVVAYFTGMLANMLPLPGGVGGVDGGMVGAFVLFGVDPATAIVAVLAYRGFSFWLPIAPGAAAFVSLRKRVGRWTAQDALTPPVTLPVTRREPVAAAA
jgi:uncharacterized membrane protein YbhN (UPF0104 family)